MSDSRAFCGLCGAVVVDGEPSCGCWEKHVRRERGISGMFELLQYLVNKYGEQAGVEEVIEGERDQEDAFDSFDSFDRAIERLDRWMK